MDHGDIGQRSERFADYMKDLAGALAHGQRTGPLTSYCTGLLSPCQRKNVEVPDLIRDGGIGAEAERGAAPADAAFHWPGHTVRRRRPGTCLHAHAAPSRRRHSSSPREVTQ